MGFLTKKETKPNSFWDTKEGNYGKVGIALLALAAIIGFTKILPTLTAFVMGTGDLLMALARLGLIGMGIWAVGFFVTRPSFKTMVFYWYRGLMSLMVNGYINKNYLKVLRTYMERCDEKCIVVKSHVKDVARNKGTLEQGVQKYKKILEEDLKRGSGAQRLLEQETDPELQMKYKMVVSEVAGRLGTTRSAIANLESQVQRSATMLAVLNKVYSYTQAMADKLKFTVEVKLDEHNMVSSAHKALVGASNVVFGGDEERRFFNQSMETMATKTGENIGDIESMLSDFKGVINMYDVDNALSEEEGRKMLAEWDAKIDAKLADGLSFLDLPLKAEQPEPVAVLASKGNESSNSAASKWLK